MTSKMLFILYNVTRLQTSLVLFYTSMTFKVDFNSNPVRFPSIKGNFLKDVCIAIILTDFFHEMSFASSIDDTEKYPVIWLYLLQYLGHNP